MQVRDLGLRQLAGPLADAHLGRSKQPPPLGEQLEHLRQTGEFPVSESGDALTVQVFEVNFRDEKHPKSDFVAFMGRERIYAGEGRQDPQLIVGGELVPDPLREAVYDTPPDDRWHISVNGRQRVPTWDELVSIAHRIREGVVFVVGVPPRSWWINVSENCLHLWELKDDRLTDLWRSERLAMQPT